MKKTKLLKMLTLPMLATSPVIIAASCSKETEEQKNQAEQAMIKTIVETAEASTLMMRVEEIFSTKQVDFIKAAASKNRLSIFRNHVANILVNQRSLNTFHEDYIYVKTLMFNEQYANSIKELTSSIEKFVKDPDYLDQFRIAFVEIDMVDFGLTPKDPEYYLKPKPEMLNSVITGWIGKFGSLLFEVLPVSTILELFDKLLGSALGGGASVSDELNPRADILSSIGLDAGQLIETVLSLTGLNLLEVTEIFGDAVGILKAAEVQEWTALQIFLQNALSKISFTQLSKLIPKKIGDFTLNMVMDAAMPVILSVTREVLPWAITETLREKAKPELIGLSPQIQYKQITGLLNFVTLLFSDEFQSWAGLRSDLQPIYEKEVATPTVDLTADLAAVSISREKYNAWKVSNAKFAKTLSAPDDWIGFLLEKLVNGILDGLAKNLHPAAIDVITSFAPQITTLSENFQAFSNAAVGLSGTALLNDKFDLGQLNSGDGFKMLPQIENYTLERIKSFEFEDPKQTLTNQVNDAVYKPISGFTSAVDIKEAVFSTFLRANPLLTSTTVPFKITADPTNQTDNTADLTAFQTDVDNFIKDITGAGTDLGAVSSLTYAEGLFNRLMQSIDKTKFFTNSRYFMQDFSQAIKIKMVEVSNATAFKATLWGTERLTVKFTFEVKLKSGLVQHSVNLSFNKVSNPLSQISQRAYELALSNFAKSEIARINEMGTGMGFASLGGDDASFLQGFGMAGALAMGLYPGALMAQILFSPETAANVSFYKQLDIPVRFEIDTTNFAYTSEFLYWYFDIVHDGGDIESKDDLGDDDPDMVKFGLDIVYKVNESIYNSASAPAILKLKSQQVKFYHGTNLEQFARRTSNELNYLNGVQLNSVIPDKYLVADGAATVQKVKNLAKSIGQSANLVTSAYENLINLGTFKTIHNNVETSVDVNTILWNNHHHQISSLSVEISETSSLIVYNFAATMSHIHSSRTTIPFNFRISIPK